MHERRLSLLKQLMGCSGEVSPGATALSCSIDSRSIGEGELFFAIPGKRVDPHCYLDRVADAGAAAAVVADSYVGEGGSLPLLRCQSPLEALQRLGKAVVTQSSARVVGITGSVGKTTTKEWLGAILREAGEEIYLSRANWNSQITLPLGLINDLQPHHRIAVQEMGISLAGEMERLAAIATPSIAIITSIDYAHFANFGSLEAICREKSQITCSDRLEWAIAPHTWKKRVYSSSPILTTSLEDSSADLFLEVGKEGLVAHLQGKLYLEAPLPLPKGAIYANLASAVLAAHLLGVSPDVMVRAISSLQMGEGRMHRLISAGIEWIDATYNASYPSMMEGLRQLAAQRGKRRAVAVIGTMPELGPLSPSLHRSAAELALVSADLLFCVGSETKVCSEIWSERGRSSHWLPDRDLLIEALCIHLCEGDLVFVKGANSLALWGAIEEVIRRR